MVFFRKFEKNLLFSENVPKPVSTTVRSFHYVHRSKHPTLFSSPPRKVHYTFPPPFFERECTLLVLLYFSIMLSVIVMIMKMMMTGAIWLRALEHFAPEVRWTGDSRDEDPRTAAVWCFWLIALIVVCAAAGLVWTSTILLSYATRSVPPVLNREQAKAAHVSIPTVCLFELN